MPFEAKRLRVQLPCSGDSLVELAPQGGVTVYVSPHLYPYCYTPTIIPRPWWITHLTIPVCPGWSCGAVPSIPGEVQPEDPFTVHLPPEQLPHLRRQLELELVQIEEIALRKGDIESQLEELDAVEKKLEKS